MKDINKSDLIEQYLMGKLPTDEAHLFEDRLSYDTELAEEFQLQKEVIRGIKEFRKKELKMRLAAITAPVSLWEGLVHSNAFKIASSATVTASVIIGITYFNSQENGNDPINIDSPTITNSMFSSIQLPVIEEIEIAEKPKTIVKAKTVSSQKPIVIATEEKSASEEQIVEVIETGKEEVRFSFNVPEVELEEATIAEPKELIDEGIFEEVKPGKVLEIETLDKESKSFRYRYFDGKLSLYGDLGTSPYQILEINNKSGKELYFLHNEVYYLLKPTRKAKQLKAVEDTDLIKDLNILKEKN